MRKHQGTFARQFSYSLSLNSAPILNILSSGNCTSLIPPTVFSSCSLYGSSVSVSKLLVSLVHGRAMALSDCASYFYSTFEPPSDLLSWWPPSRLLWGTSFSYVMLITSLLIGSSLGVPKVNCKRKVHLPLCILPYGSGESPVSKRSPQLHISSNLNLFTRKSHHDSIILCNCSFGIYNPQNCPKTWRLQICLSLLILSGHSVLLTLPIEQ